MVQALVGRVSFTGDLGYEVWCRADDQRALYAALAGAGEPLGLRRVGGRALNALRLEKGFGTWAREYRPLYGPEEAGLGRFVDWRKHDFVGRDASARARSDGSPLRLVSFAVDADGADAIGDEPIWHDGRVAGWVTSGGYGHSVGRSLALGYVPRDLATAGSGFEIEIIGARRPATRLDAPAFDPEGTRMRG